MRDALGASWVFKDRSLARGVPGLRRIQKVPETIHDLGAGVPNGTFTAFPGCAGLLIGFANRLLAEGSHT
jgi:hypothetical protein